jgi:molecular chaperone HtpG
LTVEIKSLPTDEMPIVITFPEFMRRMQEMAKTQGFAAFMNPNPQLNVGVNANHTLIQKILQLQDEAQQHLLIKQAYDLALLSQNMLGGESLTKFIERSVQLIGA